MPASILDANNALLTQARQGKRLTPIWLVIPLGIVIPILSQLGAIPLVMFNVLRHTSDLTTVPTDDINALSNLVLPQTALEQMLFLISLFAGIYLLLWLWMRFVEGRPLASAGLQRDEVLFRYGRGFGVGLGLFILAVVPGSLLGFYDLAVNPVLGLGTIAGVVMVLLGWVVQGSAEELLFRGWMLPVVGARYAVWLGIVISALMFALVHMLNPSIGPLAILNLVLFGLFTAFYTLWEKSLWGVFGLHAVWNWVQGSIFGLEVSGLASPGESLLVTQATGPDILTGGTFGPEGGLLVTLVLGVAIGVLFWLGERGGPESPEIT